MTTIVSSELPPAVQPSEVQALFKAGEVKILDVRSPVEYESTHIPGSYNVPLDLLPEHRGELLEVGAALVLVCRTGARARQAELLLREVGLPKVHVLDGGLAAWERAGLEVKKGRQHWSIERQVRAIAGGLVLLGTVGSLMVWPPLIYLAMFVGAGLLFAGVTDTCMMGMLLLRLPFNRGADCDIRAVMTELKAASPGSVG